MINPSTYFTTFFPHFSVDDYDYYSNVLDTDKALYSAVYSGKFF